MRPAAVFAAILALAFLTQGAAARWSANGDFEPDTPFDISAQRMWTAPDTSPGGMRVYFDAVYVDTTMTGNPNVGALGSRVLLPGPLTYGAFLGVWKDCNRDGYIGFAETVLLEYQSVLLTDTSVCPDASRWNRGGFVTEFIHFAPRDAVSSPVVLPRVISDYDARIWGDFGIPGVRPEPNVDCLDTPLPAGTLDSTGALLMFADCNVNYNVARAVNDADAIFGLGIGFNGEGGHYRPDKDCDNPLNQQLDLYGDSPCNPDDPGTFEGGTGRRMFNVWDCEAGDGGSRLVDVRDPTAQPGQRGQLSSVNDPNTGQPMRNITDKDGTYGVPFDEAGNGGVFLQVDGVPPVSPGVNDSDGSLWDTRAHINDGSSGCARHEGDQGLGEPDLNSRTTFDPLRGKRSNDFTMNWNDRLPVALTGTTEHRRGATPWSAEQTYGPPRGFPNGIVRAGDLKPANATYFTFYAYVGAAPVAAGVTFPDGSHAYYGSETCGSFTSGVHGGWDCNGEHWWNPLFGEDENDDGILPGHPYTLRDIDCLDGSLGGGTGVFVSISPLSEDPPCPVVPDV